MKVSKLLMRGAIFVFALGVAKSASSGVIFSDNFETGKAASNWNGFTYVTVAQLPTETGRTGYGLRFGYVGNADDTVDADAEARFDLGKEYTNLKIEFDLFVPSNYSIVKPSDSTDNNKFLRLWQVTYSVGEQVGLGTAPQGNGEASIGSDYRLQSDWGLSTGVKQASNFITKADLGKWMAVKILVTAPSDAGNGRIQVYKNNTLVLDDPGIPNTVAGLQGWRYGYLLGWANTGFRLDTTFYMDNVVFTEAAIPPPPVNPVPHGLN